MAHAYKPIMNMTMPEWPEPSNYTRTHNDAPWRVKRPEMVPPCGRPAFMMPYIAGVRVRHDLVFNSSEETKMPTVSTINESPAPMIQEMGVGGFPMQALKYEGRCGIPHTAHLRQRRYQDILEENYQHYRERASLAPPAFWGPAPGFSGFAGQAAQGEFGAAVGPDSRPLTAREPPHGAPAASPRISSVAPLTPPGSSARRPQTTPGVPWKRPAGGGRQLRSLNVAEELGNANRGPGSLTPRPPSRPSTRGGSLRAG